MSRFHIRRTRTAIVLLALSLSAAPAFAQSGVSGLGDTATSFFDELQTVLQGIALDTFTSDASSASRTIPGERLNERLASLRQFRADFPNPPECASSEFRMAINDLLRAMDDTITALEGWSNGTMDGLAVTTALQEAESALRTARTQSGRTTQE